MAAAIATLGVLSKERLPEAAAAKGEWLLGRLRSLQARHPALLVAVRGRGLMLGLEFRDHDTGFAFSRGVFARRVVISGTLVNAKTIRVEPPLTIGWGQLAEVVARFNAALCALAAERGLAPVPGVVVLPWPAPADGAGVAGAATTGGGSAASGGGGGSGGGPASTAAPRADSTRGGGAGVPPPTGGSASRRRPSAAASETASTVTAPTAAADRDGPDDSELDDAADGADDEPEGTTGSGSSSGRSSAAGGCGFQA